MRKDLLQLGVHPPVHVAEVFSSPRTARFVRRFGLTSGSALDLRTGWDLNDPAMRAKMWSHLQPERPILIVGSRSGPGARTTHMRWTTDTYRWQVSQGRFFPCVSALWTFASECKAVCDEIGVGVSCRLVENFPHKLRRDTQ